MGYKIQQTDDNGLIILHWGDVDNHELDEASFQLTTMTEELRATRYIIADHTAVDNFLVTPDGMKGNIDFGRKVSEINPTLLVAFVLPEDIKFGMGRVWESRAQDISFKLELFRSRKEADQWIQKHLARIYNS